MRGAFQRRIGGLDAAGHGVAKYGGKSASEAMKSRVSEAFVLEAKLQAFQGVGDFAGVELQNLIS